jgi:hypothetical protein
VGTAAAEALAWGASPQPAAAAAAADAGHAGLQRSDSASGLPLLLLSPPLSLPPHSSLLPLPPLSVPGGGTPAAAAADLVTAGKVAAAAAAAAEAERLLQQHFRPSSSKLTELFRPLEDLGSPPEGGDGSQAGASSAAAHRRSPRTAAELRAALLHLAQQSPPGALAAPPGALLPPAAGLPPPLALPGAAGAPLLAGDASELDGGAAGEALFWMHRCGG